jgi:phosphoserine phosphatase
MVAKMIVAFDVDDTLIMPSVAAGFGNDVPNYDNVHIAFWHLAQGHTVVIWSGSGKDWAQRWSEKLGLVHENVRIWTKERVLDANDQPLVDIAYDDMEVDLAKVNVRVKRINNSVSRAVWNKTKHVA